MFIFCVEWYKSRNCSNERQCSQTVIVSGHSLWPTWHPWQMYCTRSAVPLIHIKKKEAKRVIWHQQKCFTCFIFQTSLHGLHTHTYTHTLAMRRLCFGSLIHNHSQRLAQTNRWHRRVQNRFRIYLIQGHTSL